VKFPGEFNLLTRASDSCLMLDYVRVINFLIIIIGVQKYVPLKSLGPLERAFWNRPC